MHRVGLIGCGYMGRAHLEGCLRTENVGIYAVCDTDRWRAEETARTYRAQKIYDSAGELIADPQTEIVIIATYPSTHLELLQQCLAHGKHVLCEKPIAGNPENGRRFLCAVKAHPECKVLVGYLLRHNETYRKAREMIQAGVIGNPVVLRLIHNHNTSGAWEKYRALIRETSPVIDCGVHYVDVMRWFTGEEVTYVDGIGAATMPGLPEGSYNYGMIQVRLSGGSVGFCELGWSDSMKTEAVSEFVGPEGRLRIIYQRDREDGSAGNLISVYRRNTGRAQHIEVPYSEQAAGAQMQYLIDMIEQNIPSEPGIEDVWKSLETVCEADRMIRNRLLCRGKSSAGEEGHVSRS